MTTANTSSTRICPVCDAPNSSLSLFCAECGASLSVPVEGDTAEYTPVATGDDDPQATATYTPARTTRATGTGDSATPAANDGGTSQFSSWSPSPAAALPWQAEPDANFYPTPSATGAPRSNRGFYLGLLAGLLIVAVFLLWGWAALLDQDSRDSIQDFFGFIG